MSSTCRGPISFLLRRKLVNSGSHSDGCCSVSSFIRTGQQFLIKRLAHLVLLPLVLARVLLKIAAHRALTHVNGKPTGSLVLLPSVCADRKEIQLSPFEFDGLSSSSCCRAFKNADLPFSSVTICTIPK